MKKLGLKIAVTLAALLTVTGSCVQATAKTAKADKKTEVTIYLTRHGKTMLNTTDRSQGWIDAPLTPAGVEIAEFLGKGLKTEKVKFDAVYSSDSGRAVETANLVLKNNGQKDLLKTLKTDQRLREFNFGTYEGMPNEEMWTAIAEKQDGLHPFWSQILFIRHMMRLITIIGIRKTSRSLLRWALKSTAFRLLGQEFFRRVRSLNPMKRDYNFTKI